MNYIKYYLLTFNLPREMKHKIQYCKGKEKKKKMKDKRKVLLVKSSKLSTYSTTPDKNKRVKYVFSPLIFSKN